MTKTLHPFILLLLFVAASLVSLPALAQTPASPTAVDPEYDRYRKRGDELYREGKYLDARRQYQNCLEVPNFENDAYAKKQIDDCATGLTLRQQATEAIQRSNAPQTLDLLSKLLNFNPDDAITKAQLADFYEREGNQLFNQKRYDAAKASYERALAFTTIRQESLHLQLRNIATLSKPPKRIGLKFLTGAVAVGAGAYAFVLQNDYQTKLDALNQVNQTVDPNNTGIANPSDYQQYKNAYTAAETAQQKKGLFTTLVGVAAVATVAELYLLIHKPRPRTSALYWKPASHSYGLAIGYSF